MRRKVKTLFRRHGHESAEGAATTSRPGRRLPDPEPLPPPTATNNATLSVIPSDVEDRTPALPGNRRPLSDTPLGTVATSSSRENELIADHGVETSAHDSTNSAAEEGQSAKTRTPIGGQLKADLPSITSSDESEGRPWQSPGKDNPESHQTIPSEAAGISPGEVRRESEASSTPHNPNTPSQSNLKDTWDQTGSNNLAGDLEKKLNLGHTEDVGTEMSYNPAVTHETVRPKVHEVKEEQIYREVHNYDVYHRVQPVYDVEILPPKHFVPGPDGALTEVSEQDLPCTGQPQRWHIAKGPPCADSPLLRHSLESNSHGRDAGEKEYISAEASDRSDNRNFYTPILKGTATADRPVSSMYFGDQVVEKRINSESD
ncbi:hypothetical protein DL771_004321 [Monosporascus sp. 5C6A]|nr:hypothetical protein DL771_004321 [Monosporascus sp. 5C6A]